MVTNNRIIDNRVSHCEFILINNTKNKKNSRNKIRIRV